MEGASSSASSGVESENSASRSSSEASVASDPDSSGSGRESKRKRSSSSSTSSRKKVNTHARRSRDYRLLFNTAVDDAARWSTAAEEYKTNLYSSQVGATYWTAEQKSKFFKALARLGQHDLAGLADAAGKSVPEVTAYLNLLQRASVKQHSKARHARHVQLLSRADIPPAFEIGSECEATLEQAAYDLQERMERHQAEEEREKFGDEWLLTQDVARDLDEEVETGEDGESNESITPGSPSRRDALKCAAQLLTPSTWLALSERVFMNPGPPREEDNWFFLSGPRGGKPAIFATAFVDFFNLATIITRRLVNCALFQANSRLRAMDIQDWKPRKASVRRRDVLTALNILKMEKSSSRFWIGAARRNSLKVYDLNIRADRASSIAFRKSLGDQMDYEAVERRLDEGYDLLDVEREASGELGDGERGRKEMRDCEREQVHEDTGTNDIMSEGGDAGDDNISVNDCLSNHLEEDESDPMEEELETLDSNASHHEEQRLWSMMIAKPLGTSATPETAEPTTRPKNPERLERRTPKTSPDWRDLVDFRSEWERYGSIIPRQAFPRAPKPPPDEEQVKHQHQYHERSVQRSRTANETRPGSASPGQDDASAHTSEMKRSSSPGEGDGPTTEGDEGKMEDQTGIARPRRTQKRAPVYTFAPVDGLQAVEGGDSGVEEEYKRESEGDS